MKKTFFYLFAVVVLCSMFLVSCEPTTDVDSNKDKTEQPKDSTSEEEVELPEGTIRLQALTSQYATGADMGYSNASHNFLLMFATEECEVVMGSPFGSGDVLVFELFSKSADNLLPAAGVYPILDMEPIEDGMIVGGFDIAMGTPFGSYIHHMVDDEFVSWDLITGGGMEIKKTEKENEVEIFIYTSTPDSVEGYYYYKGELLIDNMSAVE